MNHESIRKLIFIILFAVIIIALWAMVSGSSQSNQNTQEEASDAVTYYEIKPVSSVSSALTSIDKGGQDIPGCVGSVQNSSNTNQCIVTDCSGTASIYEGNLSENQVMGCVGDDYAGEGTLHSTELNQFQLGCLASECINHATDQLTVSGTSPVLALPEDDILDQALPDCITEVENNVGNSCLVRTCNGVHLGQNNLSPQQVFGCMEGQPMDQATDAQLGCLANECLNHTIEKGDGYTDGVSYDYSHLNVGTSDPIIYTIEYELQKKGFFTLKPDQVFGYKTLDAVRLFQLSVGLPGTGKLDAQTVSKILGR